MATRRPARRSPGNVAALPCAVGLALAFALTLAGAPAVRAQGPAPTSPAAAAVARAPSTPVAVPTAADPVLEARMQSITEELRCLVCQNQTIAESHADLAADLRAQVRQMLQAGRTPEEIRRYMTDRYGDFILYKPPFKPATLLLWLGPALLLLAGATALIVSIRRRARLPDDRFEPDPAAEEAAEPGDEGGSHLQPGSPA